MPSERTVDTKRAIARVVGAAVVALAGVALVPAGAAAQSACGASYVVRSGDTLVEVAARCGVTVPALLAANPAVRDAMELQAGDRLRVPSPGDPQPSPQQACGPYYTTRSGDTLAEIAEKCGVTVPLLIAANGPLPDPLGVEGEVRIRIPDLPPSAVRDPSTIVLAPPPSAAADEPGAADVDPAGEEDEELRRLEGVLSAGSRCLLLRPASGGVVALAGDLSDGFRPGDRVVVLGAAADPARCGHDPTLEVRILYRGQ